MKNVCIFSIHTILFFIIHQVPSFGYSIDTAAVPAAGPDPPNDSSFIRTSCATTLYPELCYHSLAGYSKTVQQDPARLARVAVGVSLSRAKRMAAYVSNLSREADYGADHRATAALHDCFSLFGDSIDQIRDSLKQMRQLSGSGESLRFQMSNVQTWMSAALTNEDTCTDGFEDVPDGPMKVDICGRVVKVKEVTSNALALVNSYVATVSGP
ncbi:21 kDa protein-like [Olea europaea var. sylvestris]|uniref:21 kDa -like n=1 Tax=Olea europaea subsp. europaea TaxID=158383 RepID=A0A8S0TV39_OLEEU|nr:21 kDa protein-like [Olea europaea var. sylvestris]CAA3009326.1 21 kDa -like [Olea europaea subsp. europaea]